MFRFNKETIASLVVIVLVLGGYYVFKYLYPLIGENQPDRAGQLDISEYSLGAEVVSVDTDNNSQLTVKTGWVADGELVYYNRTVKLTSDTKVVSVSEEGTVPVLNQNPISYIRVGDKITVYGEGNPYTSTTLTTTKIEVQR